MIEQNSLEQRITGVLNRLEAVIDRENECLGKDPEFNIEQSNAYKSRCLYEMTMMFKHVDPQHFGEAQKAHVKRVAIKLNTNRNKVNAHVEAVREIADLIKQTVADSETDGTYSADQFGCGFYGAYEF